MFKEMKEGDICTFCGRPFGFLNNEHCHTYKTTWYSYSHPNGEVQWYRNDECYETEIASLKQEIIRLKGGDKNVGQSSQDRLADVG